MKLSDAQKKIICFFQFLDRREGKTRDGYRSMSQIEYPLRSHATSVRVLRALVKADLLEESLEHGYRYRLTESGGQFVTGWQVDRTGELVRG